MNYQERQPSVSLSRFIKCFWALEDDVASDAVEAESVLPDGCPEIVFNLSDRFVRMTSDHEEFQPTTLLAGQMTRSIVIRPSGNVRLFGVRFHPTGSRPLVGLPLSEITDEIVDLRLVCGAFGVEIEERMNLASTFTDRITIFETFFLDRLSRTTEPDQIASFACDRILLKNGRVSVGEISSRVGLSERQLARRFGDAVGISPKTFARVIRFQTFLRSYQQGNFQNALDVALAHGYYDQSHLIRDFKDITGRTPQAFFARTHQISDFFTKAA